MEQLLIFGLFVFVGFFIYVYVRFFKKSKENDTCPLKAFVAERAEFVLS